MKLTISTTIQRPADGFSPSWDFVVTTANPLMTDAGITGAGLRE